MKVNLYITFILIIFQITETFGQNFAPIGAEWYYNSSGGGTAPTNSEYYHLLAEKDTIFDGLKLRKIKRTYYRYQGGAIEVSPYLIHEGNNTVSLYNPKNKKLYKLFVFNASQGDTLVLDVPFRDYYTKDSKYRVVIDTIEYETFNGTNLKKYVLKQLDGFGWFSGFYLEKVGGYEWFLPLGLIIIPEANGPIRCYHDNEIDIKFTTMACDYWRTNSINDLLANRFELYPNPTSDIIQIKSDLGIDKMEVIDNSGHILLKTVETELDISELTSGVYFVRIYSDNQIIMKKIIKE